MQNRLPAYCNLHQLAEKQATMSGTLPVSKMERLVSMLASDEGEAEVELKFGKSGATRYVEGSVTANVVMQCQRCMQPMDYQIETAFRLALITDESLADRVPEDFEALVTEDQHSLSDLVEDELILALPFVVTHEDDCSGYLKEQMAQQELDRQQDAPESGKPNPFAVLKDML